MPDMQRMSEWREGVYVRLYGNMTEFEGNFRLLAYIVRKVTDFNEVCCIPVSQSQVLAFCTTMLWLNRRVRKPET